MNIRLQARTIIKKDNKILLVKNPGKSFWHVPGGGMEEDEDIIKCAIREAKEETGLNVKLGNMLYVQELHDSETKIIHFEIFFLATIEPGEVFNPNHKDIDPDGVTDMKWFTKEELQSVTVYPKELKKEFWDDRLDNKNRFLGVYC
jgi:8-oxo-dGTP diphosphatase